MKRQFLLFAVPFLLAGFLHAQEGFGFGTPEESGASPASLPSAVKIGGSAQVKLLGYPDDFRSASKLKNTPLADIFTGKLNFNAAGSFSEAVINLKLSPAPFFDDFTAADFIDESYVRAFFGRFDIEGGYRKLTWGKADSFGPLDVVNPMDYRDPTDMMDVRGRKIARPMVHASYRFGAFTRLEGVFIPWFEGHKFVLDPAKRWAPSQLMERPAAIAESIVAGFPAGLQPAAAGEVADFLDQGGIEGAYPDTKTLIALKYAQAGLRLTSTIGSSDIGFQYFYGNLFRPAIRMNGVEAFVEASKAAAMAGIAAAQAAGTPLAAQAAAQALVAQRAADAAKANVRPEVAYNRYHQIGVDYAQVIAGFNIRSEFGVNITDDLSGDDGAVYNPALVWSLGFDRDLIAGINVNLQVNESVRLLDNKVGDSVALDTEAGTDMTSTRLTLILSRKFFRDELELKATGLWGIEDRDFLILPAAIWTKGDLEMEVSGGVFGGDRKGELGQYRRNGFVKTALTYKF
ncbi:MAG: hypothetical protein LBP32_00225 [Spirochaetaceae bacterium]|jgi:hypothetical protein|nr:hypothetical protein [Spirochaetaceae bacterium]